MWHWTLTELLYDKPGIRYPVPNPLYGSNQSFKLHHQSQQLGRRPLIEEGWFRFAFVRNPWSRLVSVFVNKFLSLHDLTEPVVVRPQPEE